MLFAGFNAGGGLGLKIRHRSVTSDYVPLRLDPGTSGIVPRLDVDADYRYHAFYSLDIAAGEPASGDFVAADSVGLDYVSPGYIQPRS